jgi:Helix-turn-helix domain
LRRNTSSPHVPGGPGDELFTLAEAQAFLRLSRSSFFELLRRGEVSYVRQNARRYVWRSDLVAYLNRNRVGARDAA